MGNSLKKAIKHFFRSGSLDAMQDEDLISVLRENNMIRPVVRMTHEKLIDNLLKEFALANKAKIVESFLSGLENNQPEKRAALPAYAITLNFPMHTIDPGCVAMCDVCSAFKNELRDFTAVNLSRYTLGGTFTTQPEDLYFFLKENNSASLVDLKSIHIFKKILCLLRNSPDEDTPVTVEKKIRAIPGVKMDKEQSRGLLDLLGHIGILETPEHKGFIYEYKNIGLMPRNSRSSDWSYPVGFWKGEYGVNEDAVEFWFGDYLKRFK